jgi:hypothetical protein
VAYQKGETYLPVNIVLLTSNRRTEMSKLNVKLQPVGGYQSIDKTVKLQRLSWFRHAAQPKGRRKCNQDFGTQHVRPRSKITSKFKQKVLKMAHKDQNMQHTATANL